MLEAKPRWIVEGDLPTIDLAHSFDTHLEITNEGRTLSVALDPNPEGHVGMLVRLQSWDDRGEEGHDELRCFLGQRVRVTVEVIE